MLIHCSQNQRELTQGQKVKGQVTGSWDGSWEELPMPITSTEYRKLFIHLLLNRSQVVQKRLILQTSLKS